MVIKLHPAASPEVNLEIPQAILFTSCGMTSTDKYGARAESKWLTVRMCTLKKKGKNGLVSLVRALGRS